MRSERLIKLSLPDTKIGDPEPCFGGYGRNLTLVTFQWYYQESVFFSSRFTVLSCLGLQYLIHLRFTGTTHFEESTSTSNPKQMEPKSGSNCLVNICLLNKRRWWAVISPPKKIVFNYLQMIFMMLCSMGGNSSIRYHLTQEILSFIQVKQNKICWDKFLQIPANFEIKSQQIWDWKITTTNEAMTWSVCYSCQVWPWTDAVVRVGSVDRIYTLL
jgi:hypothetical protein